MLISNGNSGIRDGFESHRPLINPILADGVFCLPIAVRRKS
jgi:hypothetical protein